MSSTIITHDELLKRGWRKRENRGVQVVSSAVSYKNDLAPHATVDCYGYFSLIAEIAGKITQIKVNTIEELYSHLRHFGLIEPEPITDNQLEDNHWDYTRPYEITSYPVWGWAKEGDKFAVFYFDDSGLALVVDKRTDDQVCSNFVYSIDELNTIAKFFGCSGENETIASQKRINERKALTSSLNGGEGGTNA